MSILKSLFITSAISALIGFGLSNLIGFWQAFCLAFGMQVVFAFMYSSWKIQREQAIADTYQEEINELIDMCMAVVECPCGKSSFEEALFIGSDNIFECEKCGNKIKADISITPTLLTEPVDIAKTFDDLVKEKGTSI